MQVRSALLTSSGCCLRQVYPSVRQKLYVQLPKD